MLMSPPQKFQILNVMKKQSLLSISILLILFNIMVSCHSEEDLAAGDLVKMTTIKNIMKVGTWRVTSYVDHGADKTDHFAGFSFTFEAGDALTATNGTNTYTGFWTVTNTDDDDQTPNDNINFNILFSAPAHFEDITDDWDIVSQTANKVVMIDVGGSGNVDNITFEKNE
jgi:hypothetical protein